MPDPCIVRSGEKVGISDPRLSDTGCAIEPGVIIRPPTDLSVSAPVKIPSAIPARIFSPAPPVGTPTPAAKSEETSQLTPPAPQKIAEKEVQNHASAAVEVQSDPQKPEIPSDSSATAIIVAGAIAAAAAAAASSLGGVSGIQEKIASIFGSKVTVATAAVVTAGTIVAVKAIEHKMKNLESDLAKTKKEVVDTASSIDRIDALLDKLGS